MTWRLSILRQPINTEAEEYEKETLWFKIAMPKINNVSSKGNVTARK